VNRRNAPATLPTKFSSGYKPTRLAKLLNADPNGLNVVSLFSGCGGSCLGFRSAGYRILWANEFHPHAAETYRLNFPGPVPALNTQDVRTVTAEVIRGEIASALGYSKIPEIDVLEGSPPCQSFSISGRREKNWGKSSKKSDGTEQRSDDLFPEFARLLEGLKPRAFVAENVPGLLVGRATGFFLEAVKLFSEAGYVVRAKVIDASWLGVPQARRRVFIVGVRRDLGIEPPFPRPNARPTLLREALPWLSGAVYNSDGKFRKTEMSQRPCPSIVSSPRSSTHYHVTGGDEAALRAAFPDADEVDLHTPKLGPRLQAEAEKLSLGQRHDKNFNLQLADPDRPCGTITAIGGKSALAQTMPRPWRRFCIAELKRVCGFPDDFKLPGKYGERWARLGNSVPPPMARAVAQAIAEALP
jgi:DNA (cytosine-5)-methyltransferase 1